MPWILMPPTPVMGIQGRLSWPACVDNALAVVPKVMSSRISHAEKPPAITVDVEDTWKQFARTRSWDSDETKADASSAPSPTDINHRIDAILPVPKQISPDRCLNPTICSNYQPPRASLLLHSLRDLNLGNVEATFYVEPHITSPLQPPTLEDVHPRAQSPGTYPPRRISTQELRHSRPISNTTVKSMPRASTSPLVTLLLLSASATFFILKLYSITSSVLADRIVYIKPAPTTWSLILTSLSLSWDQSVSAPLSRSALSLRSVAPPPAPLSHFAAAAL
ncbi:MAG: hypothetical protein NXY57DRAFT_967382 [Lentinula lateritia]|nr:MAG: hypothetical protein NXY57DRAFT_967382 [Lentinula lateritia]